MGMQIYVQKLSNPLEEWSFDVEASDTTQTAISLVINLELPTQYSSQYVKLFFNGIELNPSSTFTDYNIQKFSHLTSTYTPPIAQPAKKHTFIGRTVQGKKIFNVGADGLTPQTAGSSAYQIKTNYPSSTNGLYWIKNDNINGGTPFQIYADMTTDGGGWTLIMLNNYNSGWTYENAILRNQSNPPASPDNRLRQGEGSDGSDNYSIISYADYIKKSSIGFQYMIDAYSRRSYGAIWTANGNYSFIQTDNSQTNITINTKFGTWTYFNNGGIGERMPWHANSEGFITTSDTGGGYWWGTLITAGGPWLPTPWMEGGCGIEGCMPYPGIMWYWVR